PLAVDYPFYSRALEVVREDLLRDLGGIAGQEPQIPFYSTVTGHSLDPAMLDASYWWHNIRRPVRFAEAIEAALAAHPEAAFVEIAPRPILVGPIADILRASQAQNPILSTLSASDPADRDPIRGVVARMVVNGVRHEQRAVFGEPPAAVEALPPYPFQPEQY